MKAGEIPPSGLRALVQALKSDTPGPAMPHDQVMGKVDAIIDVAERRQKR